jgi:hypothetical protein
VRSPTFDEIVALASRDGRICPQPMHWSAVYERLPDTRSDAYGSIPASPLILDAWESTSDEQKRERFVEHLQWAQSHGALAAVHAYLAALPEDAWHHAGEDG